jgi:hypothetical protein
MAFNVKWALFHSLYLFYYPPLKQYWLCKLKIMTLDVFKWQLDLLIKWARRFYFVSMKWFYVWKPSEWRKKKRCQDWRIRLSNFRYQLQIIEIYLDNPKGASFKENHLMTTTRDALRTTTICLFCTLTNNLNFLNQSKRVSEILMLVLNEMADSAGCF